MSTQVQTRRGNTAQTAAFTGVVAELTVDTDKKVVVVHDGTTVGGIPLSKESTASTIFNHANGAFDKANSANVLAQNAYNFANTISSGPAFAQANAAFDKANSANIIADSAYAFANIANIKIDSAFSFANTINIKTDAAFAFANTVNIKTDAAFAFSNTVNIKTDAAFTQANSANVLAQAAFDKANSVSQQGFVTVAANGTNVVADANNDTLTLSAANGVGITSNATTDTITINLTPTGVTSGTYANATHVPVFVVDAQGRLSSVTNTAISFPAEADTLQTVTTRGSTTANAINVTNTTASTSNTTGALIVAGGIGVKGNVYANAIYAGDISGTTDLTVHAIDGNGANFLILRGSNASSGDSGGGTTSLRSGSGLGTGSGGTLSIQAGDSGANSLTSATVTISGGASSNNSATAGTVTIQGGGHGSPSSSGGVGGDLRLIGGRTNAQAGTKVGGSVWVDGGSEALAGGTNIKGNVFIGTGNTGITYAKTERIEIGSNTVTTTTIYNTIKLPQVGTSGFVKLSAGGQLTQDTTDYANASSLTSGTLADARLTATGTAGTYANASHVPVITTDSKGRITAVTNTAIVISAAAITSGILAVAQGGTGVTSSTGTGSVVLNTAPTLTSVNVTNTTASTSNTTGAITVAGGIGVKGNVYADAIYDGGVEIIAFANQAFTQANSANVLAQQAFDKANTDATNITATAGVYGNATIVPVITLAANGRVSSITNTVIQSSTTSVQGIVQLNDTVTSTSTSIAATANAVNAVYNFAATKFNSSGGTISGDTTITGNLVVNGTTTTVNTSTVTTNDSLLKLAANNVVGDVLDIGFYGQANTTNTITYHGLVRQAAGNFVLFKNFSQDPSGNVINTAYVTIANTATLRANLTGGTVSSLASAIGVADGGTGATTLTAGRILIGSGTSAVTTLANTGTAGTYANASHVPVITTDAYGRVSAVTNTAIALSADAVTSGILAVARGGTGVTTSTGSGSVTLNTSPILTTPNIGVPSFAILTNATGLPIVAGTTGTLTIARGGTNQTSFTTGQRILFDGTSLASQANVTTTVTGGLAAANTITALTTNAYGDITAYTGAAIAIDTAQITSGTIADARLPTKGTAGTYGSSTIIPVITTDAYGRVTGVTNTAIAAGGTGNANTFGWLANSVIIANSTGYLSNTSNLLYYSANNTLAIAGNVSIKSANTAISNSATFVFNTTSNSLDTVFG